MPSCGAAGTSLGSYEFASRCNKEKKTCRAPERLGHVGTTCSCVWLRLEHKPSWEPRFTRTSLKNHMCRPHHCNANKENLLGWGAGWHMLETRLGPPRFPNHCCACGQVHNIHPNFRIEPIKLQHNFKTSYVFNKKCRKIDSLEKQKMLIRNDGFLCSIPLQYRLSKFVVKQL